MEKTNEMTNLELQTIEGLTEKGNLKSAVRDQLKNQVQAAFFEDWEIEDDGSFTLPLVKDVSGKLIKVRARISITAQEDFKARTSKKKEVEEVVVPSLF